MSRRSQVWLAFTGISDRGMWFERFDSDIATNYRAIAFLLVPAISKRVSRERNSCVRTA